MNKHLSCSLACLIIFTLDLNRYAADFECALQFDMSDLEYATIKKLNTPGTRVAPGSCN